MFRLIRSTSSSSRRKLLSLSTLTTAFLMLVFSPSSPMSAAASVQVSNVTVNEDAKIAKFTISLTTGSGSATVSYKTVDNTAFTSSDYTTTTTGGRTLSLNSDSPEIIVNVPIIDDSDPEQLETFFLQVTEYCDCSFPNVINGTGTILASDQPVTTPTPVPPPVVTPPPPTPKPTPVPTPTPIPTPMTPPPTTPPPVVITPPSPNSFPSVTINLPTGKGPIRSAFVKAIPDPTQLSLTAGTFIKSSLLALLLMLLILFPAELFNSTLQSNYDEVTGWFKLTRTRRILKQLQRLPSILALLAFAGIGAVINSQLSPDFGFNQSSLALVAGVFLTLVITSLIYDLLRGRYLRSRFGVPSKLRIHVIGLVIGGILVIASRLANFLPGYLYGLFTALVFSTGKQPSDEQDGEGLAVVTIGLLAVAAIGYFAWIPVKDAASHAGASFVTLVLDATLSSLWVTALIAIVFGLAPIRFFYGEQVKKWSKTGWRIIYGLGVVLFSYTLLQGGVYGSSSKTSLISVLTLFITFGAFSLLFWSYFRYRHLWRHTPDGPIEEH